MGSATRGPALVEGGPSAYIISSKPEQRLGRGGERIETGYGKMRGVRLYIEWECKSGEFSNVLSQTQIGLANHIDAPDTSHTELATQDNKRISG